MSGASGVVEVRNLGASENNLEIFENRLGLG